MRGRFGAVTILAAVLAALLLGAALAFALRAEIAERALRYALEDTPLAGASYRVAEIGFARAIVHDLRLADGGSIARATIAYRPATLLRGQGERLTLAGARLDLTGPSWVEPSGAESSWAALPFPVLVLEDLQASIATPWGATGLRLDAVLRPDRRTGSGRWRLDGAIASAAGTLELAPVAGPELRALFTVRQGALDHARLRAGALTGRVALDWAPGAAAPALVEAALEARQASWDGRALGPAALEARWDGRALEGELAFGGEGTPFAARLALAGRRDELRGGRWLVEASGEAAASQGLELARLAIAAPARLTFAAAGPLAALAEGEFSAVTATGRLDAAGLALGETVAADGATLALAVASGDGGGRDPASAQLQAGFARLTVGGAAGGAVFDHAALDLPLTLAGEDGRLLARAGPGALLRAERLALPGAGLTLQGLLAELPLAVERDGRRLYLRLTETAWLDIESLAHPRLRTLEPFSLELVAEHLPLLVLERLAGEWSWDARVKTGPTAAAFDLLVDGLEGGAATASVAGLLPRIALRLGSLGLNHLQGTMEARGGDLAIAGPDMRLAGLTVLASYNSGLSPWPQVEATATTLEDLRRPARFAPARADATLRPAWPRGEDARMEANLHMAGAGVKGRYLVNIEGHWRAEDGQLRALLHLPAITFQAGGVQPVDLSPRYGAPIDEAEGGFELRGELVREHGSWRQAWRLLLLDLAARSGAIAVEGLEGEVALTAIAPPTTTMTMTTGAAGGHRLTARRLALGGVTLTGIEAALTLPGDGSLDVQGAAASFAGGRLALAPTRIHPGAAPNALTLEAKGVELAELLARFPVTGLTGEGRIGGRLPLTFSPAGIAIEGASLAAEAPGRLRHLPPGPAAARPAPLSDFRFTALEIALERPPGGPAAAQLRIAGASPAFHGGLPWRRGDAMRLELRLAIEPAIRRALAGADAVLPGW